MPTSVQSIFNNGYITELNPKIDTTGNRSIVYELYNFNLIFKQLTDKSRRDSDIGALLDLDGINYFPRLYCYKEEDYLVMDKVSGERLSKLLEHKNISNKDLCLIKCQYLDAVNQALHRNRYDWDMKLDHFYWDKEKKHLMLIDFGFI
ncbi:hypothetical protein [Oceanobacillus sp. E9]|uniref:hypothetical protein n=1 Tax=Oceanobacillus sp. E9 TaxID=1742575 RepID=UPI001112ECD0|nr:hypothetical protein [Oceanobacillus sp. E9]